MKWYHVFFLVFFSVVSIMAGFFTGRWWERRTYKPEFVKVEVKDTVLVDNIKYYPKYEKLENVDIGNPPKLSFTTGSEFVTYDSVRTKYFESDLFVWSKHPIDSMDYKYEIYFYRWLMDHQTPTIQPIPTVTLQTPEKRNKWKTLWHAGVVTLGIAGVATDRHKEVAYGLLSIETIRFINEVWK